MKILVVDDDHAVALSLQLLLDRYNYAVDVATDGEEALQMADAFEYHLVVLDVLLPRLDGIEVCRQLRKKGFRQPILLLTGQGETQQKAIALNSGADDYLVKPFDNDELVARIQALLRRGVTTGEPILNWDHLSLDPNTRRAAYQDQLLVLTPKEYAILELFLRHQETVFSARAILDQVWSSVESPGEEAVRCHIKELRHKLAAASAPKDLIKTVYRVGYRLNPLYASSTPLLVDQSPNVPKIAELRAVNGELRAAMEQLQSTQTELQQKNQELQVARDGLEQRVADRTAELSQREAFLSSIYDGAAQSIFVVEVTETNDCRYVSFNRSAQQSTGLSQQDVQGKTPEEVFGLEAGSLFRQNYERCLRSGHSITYEDHFIFQNRPIWTLTTLSPLRNLQGRIDRIMGTVLDISEKAQLESERKQAEEQLQLSQAKFEALVTNMPGMVYRYFPATPDKTHHFTFVSRQAIDLLELAPETIVQDADALVSLIHPDDLEPFLNSITHSVKHFLPWHWQGRIITPSGQLKWIQGTSQAQQTPEGEAWDGLLLDISDRKQTEAKLRESEQQYRSLFESIDQGFCLLEVLFDANDKAIDYRFIEINQAFEQQSGLANALGKTILELVPNIEPQWAEFYGQVAKSGEAVRFEADVLSMNRIFDAYAFPSGAPGQNLVAVLFADITPRKRSEEILRRTAELDAFRVSLADALRPLTDTSVIQSIAARILGESLQATRVVYIEVVPGGEEVIVNRNYTNGVAELSGRYRLEDYRRNLTVDHQDGHTQVVTNIPDNPNYTDAEKARYREFDIAAHIDVPLMKNNQFVALLAVHQSTPRQWTETEIKLVEETAERTWAAVERARVEAALRQNEEMLRLALTGSQAGTWNWELATGKLTWSPETYQLYGLDPTKPLPTYDDWYEYSLHPDDRTWVSNHIVEVITQRQPDLQLEFRILHPQHGIRWILSLGHLTVDEQGEPVRLSGINLDISDRKQVELTLQKQIQQEYLLNDIAQDIRRSLQLNDVLSSTVHRVRAFLEVDRVVIFRFRPDWQGDVIMESVGDEWTPILSTTISDPCFQDHYIEPYRQGRVATITNIDTAGLEPCYVELLQQFQVKANLVAPILQNDHLWGLLIAHHCATPRQWQPAEIAAVQRLATQVGIAIQQSELYEQLQRELDERKQAEQRIREQAALLDIATDAILVCDLDCRILYWNQGAEYLYGWQSEEVLGQKANELL